MFSRKFLIVFTLLFFVLSFTASGFAQTEPAAPVNAPFLFVQTADSGGFDGTTLKLEGVGPTIFFSDRPYRINGHVGTAKFVETWGKAADSFKDDPPNAVLSILEGEKALNIVVELFDPEYKDGILTYRIKVLDGGTIPTSFGHASVFIDHHSSDAGWGAAGGLLGGMLLTKALDNSGQQQAQPQVVYAQPPATYYRQTEPAPCVCAPCPPCR